MTEPKRFQKQKLNDDKYMKTEEAAKVIKKGGTVLTAFALFCGLAKKYGPDILKGISKITK